MRAPLHAELFETVIDEGLDGVVVLKANDGRVVFANRVAHEYLGYQDRELTGVSLSQILSKIENEGVLERIWQVNQEGIRELGLRSLKVNGEPHSVRVHGNAFVLDGNSYHVLYFEDVTDRLTLLEEIKKHSRETVEFAALLAHDLQAPLRTVISFSEIMLRDQSQLDICLEQIKFAVQQIQQYLLDLETYARSGANGSEFEHEVDLGGVVESVLQVAAPELRDARLTVGTLPVVIGNHAQLARIVQNLLENSLNYRDPARPLLIEIQARPAKNSKKKNTWWQVSFSDNGRGFASSQAEEVFRPFRRLYAWNEVHGTGLGLTIVRRIVEAHGGKVWVESEPGVGTRILFTLRGKP